MVSIDFSFENIREHVWARNKTLPSSNVCGDQSRQHKVLMALLIGAHH